MAKKASDESKASKVKKAPAASAKNAPVKAGKVAKAPATAAFAAAAPAKPKTARSAKAVSGKTTLPSVSARQRGHYIEVAAYHIAERRNFAPGDSLADWLAAEAQIDRLIAEGKLGR